MIRTKQSLAAAAAAAAAAVGLILVSAGAALPGVVPAATADGSTPERIEAARVVAIGDIHGAYQRFERLLRKAALIDADGHWRGGDTHLVSLGDLLDRGPDSRQVMDLLRRLQGEAPAAGGRVHVVLGNHELMNLTGDLRYVSAGERAAFASAPGAAEPTEASADGLDGLRAAFAPDGPYGAWLLAQPVVLVINDTAFAHGGLSSLLEGHSVPALNKTAGSRLRELLDLLGQLQAAGELPPRTEVNAAADRLAARLQEDAGRPLDPGQQIAARRFIELSRDPLFGTTGPFWYRGNAWCHPLIETPAVSRVLASWGVRRVVVGHTPTLDRRVHDRLGGRVILADTGMLESYYRGRASALVLDEDGVSVIYDEDDATHPEIDDGGLLFPLEEAEVLAQLAERAGQLFAGHNDPGWSSMAVAGGQSVKVKFEKLSRRQRNAAQAALRLDRLLGLNLVAPVAPLRVDRSDGIATVLWPDAVNEAERAAAGLRIENHCATGTAFDLLYAFDALIGNDGRTTESIVYDARMWRLASIGHTRSFGRGADLPAYLDSAPQVLPAGLAERLRSLDQDTLEAELGEWLGNAELRGILLRRDKLLASWTIAD